MAVNESRSMKNDFFEGSTDGSTRKIRPNAGGELDLINNASRHYEPLTAQRSDPQQSPVVPPGTSVFRSNQDVDTHPAAY